LFEAIEIGESSVNHFLGTHRFQRAVSHTRAIAFQCASCRDCALEAMRTQGARHTVLIANGF
jgi:hypothetical protein